MHDTQSDKRGLRNMLRQKRRALSPAQQRRAAAQLLQQLLKLDALHASRRVALYLARDGEIDPGQVMQWLWQNGRRCFLPVVADDAKDAAPHLVFAEFTADAELKPNRFGIPEPTAPTRLSGAQLDLVLLPLVGFDAAGNRIGMGGGFYDATFAFLREAPAKRPALIGLAHDLQRLGQIEKDAWDIPLSAVVSDLAVYHCNAPAN